MTVAQTDPAPNVLERVLGQTEPVRRALYPVVVAVLALLVAYGILDDNLVPVWLGVAAALLGTGGIEAARRVAWAPATVVAEANAWQAALDDEYARGVADAVGRTPEKVAAEVLDDEPGEHAAPEPEPEPATGMMTAPSRATRCREVDDGRRCLLTREHTGPHMMTTG